MCSRESHPNTVHVKIYGMFSTGLASLGVPPNPAQPALNGPASKTGQLSASKTESKENTVKDFNLSRFPQQVAILYQYLANLTDWPSLGDRLYGYFRAASMFGNGRAITLKRNKTLDPEGSAPTRDIRLLSTFFCSHIITLCH